MLFLWAYIRGVLQQMFVVLRQVFMVDVMSSSSPSNYNSTPFSRAVKAIRDHFPVTPVSLTLNPKSLLGLVFVTIVLVSLSEFIYYWQPRLLHKYLFH